MRRSGENGFGSEFFVIIGTGFEGRGGRAFLYSTGSIFEMGGVCEREGRFLAEYAFTKRICEDKYAKNVTLCLAV